MIRILTLVFGLSLLVMPLAHAWEFTFAVPTPGYTPELAEGETLQFQLMADKEFVDGMSVYWPDSDVPVTLSWFFNDPGGWFPQILPLPTAAIMKRFPQDGKYRSDLFSAKHGDFPYAGLWSVKACVAGPGNAKNCAFSTIKVLQLVPLADSDAGLPHMDYGPGLPPSGTSGEQVSAHPDALGAAPTVGVNQNLPDQKPMILDSQKRQLTVPDSQTQQPMVPDSQARQLTVPDSMTPSGGAVVPPMKQRPAGMLPDLVILDATALVNFQANDEAYSVLVWVKFKNQGGGEFVPPPGKAMITAVVSTANGIKLQGSGNIAPLKQGDVTAVTLLAKSSASVDGNVAILGQPYTLEVNINPEQAVAEGATNNNTKEVKGTFPELSLMP